MKLIVRSRSTTKRRTFEIPGRRLSFMSASLEKQSCGSITDGELINVNWGSLPSHPKISLTHTCIALDFRPGSGRRHPAGFKYVSAVGDGESRPRILLDQEHGHPVPLELTD